MTVVDNQALEQLYSDFTQAGVMALWTQRADLMPDVPRASAVPRIWEWAQLLALAERAGRLVPVGRGGERRAIALANPGLGGAPFATPTLWAAIQYLAPKELAPAHRHSQSAFRFVVEGEGVWTVVDGDPVAMRRGDLLLTPSMSWHEHHNTANEAMVWLDGLDIPLVAALDAGFFELGPGELTDRSTPYRSRSEALWAHPGLVPVARATAVPNSPLVAYRWSHTDEALDSQLDLERSCPDVTLEPGHAGVRFSNPSTGGDALATMRLEMHRLSPGTKTARTQSVGSSVWQVFSGGGAVELSGTTSLLNHGDVVAVPSWCPIAFQTTSGMDIFCFSDAPIYEALGLARTKRSPGS